MPTDLIPQVIEAAEWEQVSRAAGQRVRAAERFLADVYGPGHCFDDGVLPWRLACTSGRFRREVAGLVPSNGVRVHVASLELVRDGHGTFRVLRDNVRVPVGVGYLLDGARAIAGLAAQYPSRLLGALRAAAPGGIADPLVVVLTPGVHSPAYLEHALLARLMGVELVEGRDLSCWRNRVYLRATGGRRPVDVIYRRIDEDWLDPLQFRPESMLGCPGLINAARAGRVTIANAVGNGVADEDLIRTFMPDLIRYYLAEEPLLENAEPAAHGGARAPHGAPAGPRDLALGPARLRLFAVNDGREVWVLPGALARPARVIAEASPR